MKLEVCVDNIASVKNAFEGGADRIELCSALSEGGLTPSLGFLQAARQVTSPSFPIFVMIRPRGGNFVYDETELKVMADDIQNLKKGGADGFVFGLLSSENRVDINGCKSLMHLTKPLPVTFHRAFDEVVNPEEEIEKIIELGFSRLLTSGQATTAEKGKHTISRLNAQSNGRLIVMPGSGIALDNLESILLTTGAIEFHGSAKAVASGGGCLPSSTSINVVRTMKDISNKLQ